MGGSGVGTLGSGLHLDKDETVSVPEHQIDLAARGTVVLGQESHPLPRQMLAGGLFAEVSQPDV